MRKLSSFFKPLIQDVHKKITKFIMGGGKPKNTKQFKKEFSKYLKILSKMFNEAFNKKYYKGLFSLIVVLLVFVYIITSVFIHLISLFKMIFIN